MTSPLTSVVSEAAASVRMRFDAAPDPWETQARPEQLPPKGSWRVWLLCTGRRWGKNRTQSEWAHKTAGELPGEVGFIAGRTLGDVARNVVHNPRSGLMATARPGNPCEFGQCKGGTGGWEVRWRNGARAEIHTSEEPDRARGMEYSFGLADEIATWKRVVDFQGNTTWDNLYISLSAAIDGIPRVVAGTTPRRGSTLLRSLLEQSESDDSIVVTRGTIWENRANLSAEALADFERKYAGTHLGRQELDGDLLPAVEGAIVTPEMIEAGRVVRAPDLQRIVVGVDPSGGGTAQGIVAVGLGVDGQGYVLADRTCNLKPMGWGLRAVELYHALQADRILGERNYGGDMVESTIRTVDPNVSYRDVTASRGKHVRFEPVGSLYEQQRIHHVGHFPELEDEVCCFTPDAYEGEDSPNRADAEVWAVTDLMLGGAMSVSETLAMMEASGVPA